MEVKFDTIDDINEELKNRLGCITFENYTPEINKKIEQVFKDLSVEITPQILILEDIQFFSPEFKIEYICQSKHYTMIFSPKK
jgi:hypothetical protein